MVWWRGRVIHHLGGGTQGVKGLRRSSSLAFAYCDLTCCLSRPKPSYSTPVTELLVKKTPTLSSLHVLPAAALLWSTLSSPSDSLRGSLCSETVSLSTHLLSTLLSACLLQNPGQGAADGLYFSSGICTLLFSHTLHSDALL